MKIAIDLDGTAFKFPVTFTSLALSLIAGGADVVFLTAAAGELSPEDRPAEVGRRVLKRLPLLKLVPIFCVDERNKGSWLSQNNFDLVIDDKPIPGVPCLQLCPLD